MRSRPDARVRRGGPATTARPSNPGRRAVAHARLGGERGAVTAEVAVALPAVVLVLAALLVTGSATVAQVRCVDAARTAARLAAVGHTDAEVLTAATRVAGGTVSVEVARTDGWVDVTVRREIGGAWFTGGPLGTSARATAWSEPVGVP